MNIIELFLCWQKDYFISHISVHVVLIPRQVQCYFNKMGWLKAKLKKNFKKKGVLENVLLRACSKVIKRGLPAQKEKSCTWSFTLLQVTLMVGSSSLPWHGMSRLLPASCLYSFWGMMLNDGGSCEWPKQLSWIKEIAAAPTIDFKTGLLPLWTRLS